MATFPVPVHHRALRILAVLLGSAFAIVLPGADVARAAAPTISSFIPTSGPVGASVEINGDNFRGPDPDVTAVRFNGVSAAFTIDNPHRITATVPAGATTGPISVTSPDGTATSASNFTVTASQLPTINSFNPTSGPVGTSVHINGTNLTGATAVRFDGVAASVFSVNQPGTRITATVPAGATTGPISVTTPGGTATSSTNFTVTVGPTAHERTIVLELRRHLVARGVVSVDDGFDACADDVTVNIQRYRNGGWRTIDSDQTNDDGIYREPIPDRTGRHRAVAVREELNAGADVCRRDRSPARRHQH